MDMIPVVTTAAFLEPWGNKYRIRANMLRWAEQKAQKNSVSGGIAMQLEEA